MRIKRRYELADAQWARLESLLPPEKPWTGRPNDDHRRIVNGILWVLNSGAPWRDLPRRYGPVGTVSSRFYRWRRVAPCAGGVAGPGRRRGAGRLGTALPGQHGRTSTPPGRARRAASPR